MPRNPGRSVDSRGAVASRIEGSDRESRSFLTSNQGKCARQQSALSAGSPASSRAYLSVSRRSTERNGMSVAVSTNAWFSSGRGLGDGRCPVGVGGFAVSQSAGDAAQGACLAGGIWQCARRFRAPGQTAQVGRSTGCGRPVSVSRCWATKTFPNRLQHIPDPPLAVYYRGTLELGQELRVAVGRRENRHAPGPAACGKPRPQSRPRWRHHCIGPGAGA